MTKIVAISDTHLRKIPDLGEGDILIHAGDATMNGTAAEVAHFGKWLDQQKFRYKIFVPGNHDFLFETNRTEAEALIPDEVITLIGEGVTVEGLKIYGWPWISLLSHWAFFNGKRKYHPIPVGLDILVTHGPAQGILDAVPPDIHAGSRRLKARIALTKPRYHVFGHIHESGGKTFTADGTTHVNVAACDEQYVARRVCGMELNL